MENQRNTARGYEQKMLAIHGLLMDICVYRKQQESDSRKEYAPGLAPVPTPENTVTVDVEEAKCRLQDPQVQEEIRAILTGEAQDGDASVV